MKKVLSIRHRISIAAATAALFAPACGGSEPAPAPPPAPPPMAPPAAPAAAAPAPVAPAATAEAPPPAPPPAPEHHHHGMAALFFSSLRNVELKPEQKTQVDAIETDLENLGQQHKPAAQKLGSDIADGVAAGKIDHKKTDADVKDVTKAVEGTIPAVQDAVNRLYKTLDAAQRKTVVEGMRAQAEHMREHGGMMGEHGGMMGGHEHGEHGEHGGAGMGHEHGGPGGPPAPGATPAASGPGAPPPAGGPGMGGPGMGGPGMGGPGMGGPGMHGEHGGPPGPEDHEPGAMMAERLGDALGLTPEQRQKLKTKLDAHMKTVEAGMKARMATAEKQMKAIGDAFASESFDAKKVGVGQHAPEMAKTMAQNQVTFAENVLSVLTPEQRPKFAEHLRAHASDHD